VTRDGDFFGRTVNLAATPRRRRVDGEIWTTPEFAGAAGAAIVFEQRARRSCSRACARAIPVRVARVAAARG
jgi:hypothetical protein